jgi:tRNA threonylcarbamoyladenosine biosynthesis protein TsaB
MALILHLETATAVCSAALGQDGELVAIEESGEGLVHGEMLAVYIDRVLRRAQMTPRELDAVAVSMGPGSYTGLRVGLSTAKGMCFALGIPLIAIPTLEALALALQAEVPGRWQLAALDARRQEVYALLADPEGRVVRGPEPLVLDQTPAGAWLPQGCTAPRVGGDGSEKVIHNWNFTPEEAGGTLRCSARHLMAPALTRWNAGDFADLAYSEPVYLKPANVTEPRQRPFGAT